MKNHPKASSRHNLRSSPLILCLVAVLSQGAFAGGVRDGGGGGFTAARFAGLARELARSGNIPGVDSVALQKAILQTRVEAVNELMTVQSPANRAEVVVDAVNYPELKVIQFNPSSFEAKTEADRRTLVLHEYLGILGIDDSGYRVSSHASRIQIVSPSAESAVKIKGAPGSTILVNIFQAGRNSDQAGFDPASLPSDWHPTSQLEREGESEVLHELGGARIISWLESFAHSRGVSMDEMFLIEPYMVPEEEGFFGVRFAPTPGGILKITLREGFGLKFVRGLERKSWILQRRGGSCKRKLDAIISNPDTLLTLIENGTESLALLNGRFCKFVYASIVSESGSGQN